MNFPLVDGAKRREKKTLLKLVKLGNISFDNYKLGTSFMFPLPKTDLSHYITLCVSG